MLNHGRLNNFKNGNILDSSISSNRKKINVKEHKIRESKLKMLAFDKECDFRSDGDLIQSPMAQCSAIDDSYNGRRVESDGGGKSQYCHKDLIVAQNGVCREKYCPPVGNGDKGMVDILDNQQEDSVSKKCIKGQIGPFDLMAKSIKKSPLAVEHPVSDPDFERHKTRSTVSGPLLGLTSKLSNGIPRPEVGRVPKRCFVGSYEELLFRSLDHECHKKTQFSLELCISKWTNGDRQVATKRHNIKFSACLALDPDHHPQSPWTARVELPTPINITPQGAIQFIIRDDAKRVGKVFLVRVDVGDMPMDHETIVRQKHYYSSNAPTKINNPKFPKGSNTGCILHHGIQLCIRKTNQGGSPKAFLDSNGNVRVKEAKRRDRYQIFKSLRLVFMFNQAPTIGSDLAQGSLEERLFIATEFPLGASKYIPIPAPASDSINGNGSCHQTFTPRTPKVEGIKDTRAHEGHRTPTPTSALMIKTPSSVSLPERALSPYGQIL